MKFHQPRDLAAFDEHGITEAVRDAFSQIAVDPSATHAIPVGRQLAEGVGYLPDRLDSLPRSSVDAFAGVSDVSIRAPILRGSTVVDVGCGAGMDSLIAASRVGPDGAVVGIDFSDAMVQRARKSAAEARSSVDFRLADASCLPIADGFADVVLVNGIFNLSPPTSRATIFRELRRILRPGGKVFAAELVLLEALDAATPATRDDWFS